jgi:hypothetical protein
MTDNATQDDTKVDELDRAMAEKLFGRVREETTSDSETKRSEKTSQNGE